MSSAISPHLVRVVRLLAGDLCEYCRLPQATQEATFHVDHIEPRIAGGPTVAENLALACVTCSLKKAARQTAWDSRTQKEVRLFNPRSDHWEDHFSFTKNWRLRGRTATGRATAELLGMNRLAILLIRNELVLLGRFPG